MRTSEVLNLAADLIEERGWGTGNWRQDGPLCIEGAILAAMGEEHEGPTYCPAANAVREYVGDRPFIWNDALQHKIAIRMINERRDDWETAAFAEGQARVIETLRAVALIEAAREQTRDHVVTTSANHVRIVAARHDLELVEVDGYLLATLFVPALGEAIVYQAPVEVSA